MNVSIVVPCYNEEKNIEPLVSRFTSFASKADVELLLVDNGSSDSTQSKIKEQMKHFDFVKLVVVERNEGYGNGILQGLKAAKGNILGWIHADLQSAPEVFIPMISASEHANGDFLYKGARKKRSISDVFFTIGMAIYESLLFHSFLWDINSQPTLISRGFFNKMHNPPKDFALDLYAYVLAKKEKIMIKRFESIQYKRISGVSTWNTNWYSRLNMVKRVIQYSKRTKKILFGR